jgi:hypothetical protein
MLTTHYYITSVPSISHRTQLHILIQEYRLYEKRMKRGADKGKNTEERMNKNYIRNGEEGQGCHMIKKDTSEQ